MAATTTYQQLQLFEAVRQGNVSKIGDIFQSGFVHVNAQTESGDTALHLAILFGHYQDVVPLLITKNANVNLVNNTKDSPLHMAALKGNIEVAQMLIESGAELNAKNNLNMTPFHITQLKGFDQLSQYLMQKGARNDDKLSAEMEEVFKQLYV